MVHRGGSNLVEIRADPRFQIRGGALKKIAQREGDAKISVVFRVKNHDFTQKNLIFPNAPLDPPLVQDRYSHS